MAKESKIVIFHGKVLFFIVKKIRNYDCGPWLLYDLAEEPKRCFTKKRRTTLPKNLFALISSLLVQVLVALKAKNFTVVVLFCFVSNIFWNFFLVMNVLVFNANILGTRHTLI